MRFRLGVLVGFAGGYYLGAMAGRERYEQINRWLRDARRSEAFETAAEKAKAVADLGVERAKDLVDGRGNNAAVPQAEPGPLSSSPSKQSFSAS